MSNDASGSPLDELRQAVIHQKTANLPDQPEVPELADLHAEIHAYDAFVAETVFTVLQGKPSQQDYPRTEVLDRLLFEAASLTLPEAVRALRKYQMYRQRLDRMLKLARAASTHMLSDQ
ncbi:MAG TPA: hypothetical protein GYA06_04705 [Chloroflexi bacterium]|nr:hypothetical protein [Chloroflexota bacterium]